MNEDEYKQACLGKFTSILKWEDLDAFWRAIQASESPWYIYDTGQAPPGTVVDANELTTFLGHADTLLRERHEHDYCGIVYADNLEHPRMVKIYDPDNLGVVCGYSDNPPLPKWILSHIRPTSLARPEKSPPFWRKWLPDFQ